MSNVFVASMGKNVIIEENVKFGYNVIIYRIIRKIRKEGFLWGR